MDLSFKDIIPIGPHLLIEVEETEKETAGGIIIPDKLKDQRDLSSSIAKILAKGDEAFLDYEQETPIPEVGEQVITARYCGLKVDTIEGTRTICKDEDVLAVIRSK